MRPISNLVSLVSDPFGIESFITPEGIKHQVYPCDDNASSLRSNCFKSMESYGTKGVHRVHVDVNIIILGLILSFGHTAEINSKSVNAASRGKTNNVASVSEQVQHKPSYTLKEDA